MDFFIGVFNGPDVFIPWERITFAYLATPEHDEKACMQDFIALQASVEQSEGKVDADEREVDQS